jgi:hypothetical protein
MVPQSGNHPISSSQCAYASLKCADAWQDDAVAGDDVVSRREKHGLTAYGANGIGD